MKKNLSLIWMFLLFVAAAPIVALDQPDAAHQVTPEQLAQELQTGKQAPLILNVGPRALYDQAHIRGSEYMGAASTEEGQTKLRARVKALPKKTAIVVYCGCCPWDHCPNVGPAIAELRQLGFTHVKALFVAHNIGTDWVEKGYPVEKGK